MAAQTPTVKWIYRFSSNERVASPCVGADGTIYVGSSKCKIYAISADGEKKWAANLKHPIISTPVLGADGTIYVATLYSLVAVTPDCQKKWELGVQAGIGSCASPVIGRDGTIYIAYSYKCLCSVTSDGHEKWRFDMDNRWFDVWELSCYDYYSSPAISPDGRTIYFGSANYDVYAVDTDGRLVWSFPTGDAVLSSPAVGVDGTVYVGSLDFKLYAIGPDGRRKWAFDTRSAVRSSPAIGADGTIYVGSDDGRLYAIAPDGSKKWEVSGKHAIRSSPVLGAEGTIYAWARGGRFMAVSPTGERRWVYRLGGCPAEGEGEIGSPAIAGDGTIYVGCGAELHAIGP